MADPVGFVRYPRVEVPHRPVWERIRDWQEVDLPLPLEELRQQAARCMDCGIPYCHAVGCPLQNRIPEFNDLVYQGRWKEAAENLHSTNNFPEITGRVCPAPCEAACTLELHCQPINIKHIEYQIAERAFAEGWVRPIRPRQRTGKRVAVVGSGPAGLAAAQQLARFGHQVVLFEREDRIGGLLRYGIPDFKLAKSVLDRRLEQMAAEGVRFEPGVHVGVDISPSYLLKSFDAVCLCLGAREPRRLQVPGAELQGVHLAMDFLSQQNRRVAGDRLPEDPDQIISAQGKHVVVIGGGDTGSDCVGTAIRQGAISVTQIEILPKPPEHRAPETPWPLWPKMLRTSTSHEEGCQRLWSVLTKRLSGEGGRVRQLHACLVDWVQTEGGWQMKERPGTDFTLPADLVLLAMGFTHVEHQGVVDALGLELDNRGNLRVQNWMTSLPGVFAAGDAVRGASLVVHAIREGRLAAQAIHQWLQSHSICQRGCI
ncbi:MAG: glutamate synthase subunit beta [Thermoguttaceae bacterium]|nr:glutamate synthase subunit beta [Thermoguttaceae bacterium]MDW8037450.1 glutamate synthase subunit beta [Thermoguttaceae bacterium]